MALILYRNAGQSVLVGQGKDAITVKVLECSSGRCRLAFEGPRSVPINRAELCERMVTDGKGGKDAAEDL